MDDLYSLAGNYNLGGQGLQMPEAQPAAPTVGMPRAVAPNPGAAMSQPGGEPDLAGMLHKYQAPQSEYAGQLQEALKRQRSESDVFNKLIETAMTQKDAGPSKTELYFRLASAFGAPTKTGNFFESLGKAGETMADFHKETRMGEQAQKNKALELALARQKFAMEDTRGEVNTLRSLTGEEMRDARASQIEEARDKRATALKKLELYIASGKPQSEGGKYAADLGLKPGTPEYQKAVETYVAKKTENGDLFKQAQLAISSAMLGLAQNKFGFQQEQAAKLSPTEVKLKTETEDTLGATTQALEDLSKAYKLNPNTFDTSFGDVAQRKLLEAAGSKDSKLLATREQENLLAKSAVGKLRASFGGNPTEGERKILLDLEGIGAKSIEERKRVMQNAYRAAKANVERQQKRLNEINAGLYKSTSPTPELE